LSNRDLIAPQKYQKKMCYHYGLAKDKNALEKRFKAKAPGTLPLPFFHVSAFDEKAQALPVITDAKPESIQCFQWGIVPSWSATKSVAYQTQNAKIETLQEKPAFRSLFQQRHCLIPSDGFYEWQHTNKQRTPYFISVADQPIFAFAGLWDGWFDDKTGATLHTFTIVTTEANRIMAEIHNTKKRMPLILRPEDEAVWLKPPLATKSWKEIALGLPSNALLVQPANAALLKIPDSPQKRQPIGFQSRLFT